MGAQGNTPKIAIQVKAVSVLATVRDKHGKIINNLAKEDFAVTEDGRPQTISYFVREGDVALRLGLLVDTSLSQRRVLDQERSASYSFLDQLLRQDKDLAFVIHFDRDVELLQDFTASRPKLQAALQSLQTPQYDSSSGSGGGSQAEGVKVVGVREEEETAEEAVAGDAEGTRTAAERLCMMRFIWRRMS